MAGSIEDIDLADRQKRLVRAVFLAVRCGLAAYNLWDVHQENLEYLMSMYENVECAGVDRIAGLGIYKSKL